MGKFQVRFKCHHCGYCCTDAVCFPTPADVIRLVKATKADPRDFLTFITPDEITGVEKNDPAWLYVEGEKYMMALKRKKEGCYFLHPKTRYCTAYEHRPILCRLFPFKLHETRKGEFKSFTLHSDVECPRHQDGQVETAPLYELYLEDCKHHEDYNDLVTVFNRKLYPGKKSEDFIQMFIDLQ